MKYTDLEIANIVWMRQEGMHLHEIAEVYGRTIWWVRNKIERVWLLKERWSMRSRVTNRGRFHTKVRKGEIR